MLPLHLAFMTITYVFGALRLRGEHDLMYLRLIPAGIGVIVLMSARFFPASLPTLLWPIIYPLEAGFGAANWLTGFALAVLLASVSLLRAILWLHLS